MNYVGARGSANPESRASDLWIPGLRVGRQLPTFAHPQMRNCASGNDVLGGYTWS
jgi:hypothetical protein